MCCTNAKKSEAGWGVLSFFAMRSTTWCESHDNFDDNVVETMFHVPLMCRCSGMGGNAVVLVRSGLIQFMKCTKSKKSEARAKASESFLKNRARVDGPGHMKALSMLLCSPPSPSVQLKPAKPENQFLFYLAARTCSNSSPQSRSK